MLTCSICIIVKLRKGANVENSDVRRKRDFAHTILTLNIYFLVILLPYCAISMLQSY